MAAERSEPPSLPPAAASRPTKTSGVAMASLVLGLLSCPCTFVAGIPAIICGAVGLSRIASSGKSPSGPVLTGQGLAVTGLVLGSLNTLITPVLLGLLLPAVQVAREAARRTECMTHVRMLAQGMMIAETATGNLPAAILDDQGQPLLSWRVAILPYIDEGALYSQFHLDEPWDSEHNRSLIPKMPAIYVCPSSPVAVDEGLTTYLAAAGPGMALDGPTPSAAPVNGVSVAGVPIGNLADGPSKTILVVEVAPGDAVPWTKPEDFACTPEQAHHRLFHGTNHAGGIHVAVFGDAHVQPLTPGIDPQTLAAFLTRAGGEVVSRD